MVENNRLITLLILGPIKKDHVMLCQLLAYQILKPLISRVSRQFLQVAFLKFLILSKIMAEPFPQFSAGANLLEPDVEMGVDLGNAAWPESVDEDTEAV